jgi:hypothetical protein
LGAKTLRRLSLSNGCRSPSPKIFVTERETVTMLFADVKGSMELIGDLDPEEACAIVLPSIRL